MVFWILRVHGIGHGPLPIGTFMPNSTVFIFLMLCALYRMIYQKSKGNFGVFKFPKKQRKYFHNFCPSLYKVEETKKNTCVRGICHNKMPLFF